MKRLIFVITLLMIAIAVQGQEVSYKLDKTTPLAFGKSTFLTNAIQKILGGDTVSIGGLKGEIVYALNWTISDTSYKLNKYLPLEFGKRTAVTNKRTEIFYRDTTTAGKISGKFVYILNSPPEFSTSTAHTWTGTQTFSNIVANTLILNKIDSARSIYLYRANGSLFAYFDATKDSAYVDGNMYIRGLTGQTILTSTSVTSNKFITDTLQSHSPTLLYADSISFGKTNDTARVWYNQITTANSTRGSFYPKINLGSDLGLATNQFRNIRGRTLNADSVKFTVQSLAPNGSSTAPSYSFTNSTTSGIYHDGSFMRFTGGIVFDANTAPRFYGGAYIWPGQFLSFSSGGKAPQLTIDNNNVTNYLALSGYTSGTNGLNIYDKGVSSLSTSYRRLNIGWTADSTAVIGVQDSGQYNARPLHIQTKNTTAIAIDTLQNVSINGNLTVNGNLTSTNYAYGSAYISDDNPDSIVVSSSSVYYTVGAKQGANGYKLTSGGVLKNVTVQDSSITVGVAGNYEVSYSFSFRTVTGAVSARYNWYIFVNDVRQEKTGAKRLMSGTNDLGIGSTAPTVLTLAANDVIKLKILSPDDNSNTVAFDYCIIHVKKIDN